MTLQNITNKVNTKLAGEMLTYNEIMPFLDDVIDLINSELNTIYPAFSELPVGTQDYNMFEDKWIRQVVVPGAAWKYYVTDEEGLQTAVQYQQDFYDGLFKMVRDTLYNIPLEYQANVEQGSVIANIDNEILGDRGIVLVQDYYL